jgi:hypothetical protein
MKNSLHVIAILAGLVFLQSPLLGSDEGKNSKVLVGTIKGRVADVETKGPIVGATVRILNSDMGAYANTEGPGRYVQPAIQQRRIRTPH